MKRVEQQTQGKHGSLFRPLVRQVRCGVVLMTVANSQGVRMALRAANAAAEMRPVAGRVTTQLSTTFKSSLFHTCRKKLR
jgi:hypothetical protein